ncbi:hypothetical protein ACIGZJ_10195 [Kitasatospora sp. NPDC052868]|uniref:hypothetical protein n=1 Tax=Kitasatospora sp. NPDC052868 TaxID=3364060 RepID=UPI0037C79BBC
MTHNDVARRTAREMPARSLTPRTLAFEAEIVEEGGRGLRDLLRALPARVLGHPGGGGR